jgi:hypothetical protein
MSKGSSEVPLFPGVPVSIEEDGAEDIPVSIEEDGAEEKVDVGGK